MDAETTRYTLEKYIESNAQLFKGTDGIVYARFCSEVGVEIVSVDGERFEQWLTRHCIESCLPVRKSTIRLAIEASKSNHWPTLDRVCVRVGTTDAGKEVYWDLADKTGRAVHVTATGWGVIEVPSVLFPTHQSRGALTHPEKGVSIHRLRDMFGLSAHDEALIVSFCLGCLRGSGPYPILVITGPDNCGKTTLARYLRALLDSSTLELRNLPKKEAELAASASTDHLLAYDDVQALQPWLGAAICKLSKGTTFSECRGGREHILFQGARPIILAGNDEMLLNRELTSRALIVRLEPRINFASDTGNSFEELAQIRGALLDIVSHGLNRWHNIKISEPLRDYEFEKWIAACEFPHWGLGKFQEAYESNVSDGLTDLVQLDPLLIALRDYMAKAKSYRGTAGQLLRELNAAATIAKGNHWPRSPRALSGRLRRDRKLLLPEIEMELDIKEGRNRDRLIVANIRSSPERIQEANDEQPKVSPQGAAQSRRKATAKRPATTDLPLFMEG